MQLVFSNAKFFKQCVDAIVNLVDEGAFEVSSEGLHLRTMDPSQIAMVDFTLPKKAFEKIEASEEKALVSVNLSDLSKVLGRSRESEKLGISMHEKEENKLLLEFEGTSKRKFKLPLLDSSSTMPREPKVPFDSEVKIRGGAFKEMLRDATLLSSHVTLDIESNAFIVAAKWDSGDLHVETKKESLVELKSGAKSKSMFPLEYLDDITRACPEDAIMTIGLKSDAPVRISYAIQDATLSYYLAPRVENQ